jgi:KDO2-lipid IV(A) lauroyltransferase
MDQKFNEGLSVPFFGKEAMTASAIARLAKKFQCPLVPVQVERKPNAHFRVTFHPPLCTKGTEYDILQQVNAHLEQWILETPDQWLWLHNRWPKI